MKNVCNYFVKLFNTRVTLLSFQKGVPCKINIMNSTYANKGATLDHKMCTGNSSIGSIPVILYIMYLGHISVPIDIIVYTHIESFGVI